MNKISLAKANPKLAKQWHPVKNENITPDNVTASSHKKAWWVCKKGHEWEAIIKNRNNGTDCPYCSGKKANKENCLATVNSSLAEEWDLSKNEELTPWQVTSGSKKEVWWKCKNNPTHIWKASIDSRNRGNGCPYCSNKITDTSNCLQSKFPDIAKDWHPTKNHKMTPELIVSGSHYKAWWQCKKNKDHIWEAKVVDRTRKGSRCPYCNPQTSIMELRLLSEIKYLFNDVIHRAKLIKQECDLYIPRINLAIEIDGSYWHKNKQFNDQLKNKILIENNIKILRLRGKGLNKISNTDIIFDETIIDFNLVKNILIYITKNCTVPKSSLNKINNYLGSGTFKNEKYFNYLLNSISSSLPGKSLFEVNPSLSKEWNYNKNHDLTPRDVTANSNLKVWWVCKNKHEWLSTVNNRSAGWGCPYCSNKAVCEDNCLSTTNPALAKEWHKSKNLPLTTSSITAGSNKKIWWTCSNGHDWKACVADRNRGSGCPYCAGKKADKVSCLETLNPSLAKEWNYEKNGSINPKNITPGSNRTVWWKCNKGHEWKAKINNRNNEYNNCPYCSGKKKL